MLSLSKVKAWVELQDEQEILSSMPTVLVGARVKVYRAEGTTQWFSAVLNSFVEASNEFKFYDDSVLQPHEEDPKLTQFALLDGVVDAILKGDDPISLQPRRSRASTVASSRSSTRPKQPLKSEARKKSCNKRPQRAASSSSTAAISPKRKKSDDPNPDSVLADSEVKSKRSEAVPEKPKDNNQPEQQQQEAEVLRLKKPRGRPRTKSKSLEAAKSSRMNKVTRRETRKTSMEKRGESMQVDFAYSGHGGELRVCT